MKRFTHTPQFKDHFAETRLLLNRIVFSVVFIFILILIIASRLIYLQVINHDHYTTLSEGNRVNLSAIPPNRGLIYDRNGKILAENLPSYRLEITPEQVDDMDKLLLHLPQLIKISDDDLKQFKKHLKRKREFNKIPIRFRLTDEEIARIAAINHRLPGVYIVADLTRHYPLKGSLAHIIGYVGRIDENDLNNVDNTNYKGTSHIGKNGIEKYYEDRLHGIVGYQQAETNARGRILRILERTPTVAGQNLHLTLDAELQITAEQAMGDSSGAVVAIQPGTGEILAMVSTPGFDPNAFVNGIPAKQYNTLRDSNDQPLFNRALRGQYPPGSTLKPFLGLAGLNYGVVNRHYEQFCPGYYRLPGEERKFRDWKKEGHGEVDLNTAITQSCDVYFYDLARNLGIDRIYPFLSLFGFGKKTNIDLYGEKPGLMPSRQWKRDRYNMPWFPGETLNTGIGQGFVLTTPLQLAFATSTLALRGKIVQPKLLKTSSGQSDKLPTIRLLKPITNVAKGQWDYIIKSMVNVVNSSRGTARSIASGNYKIAGKTGTAQVFGIKQEEEYEVEEVARKLRDHALFIAFAPAEKPAIAIAVVVENGGSGGSVAAPIAGKIIKQYLARITHQAAK